MPANRATTTKTNETCRNGISQAGATTRTEEHEPAPGEWLGLMAGPLLGPIRHRPAREHLPRSDHRGRLRPAPPTPHHDQPATPPPADEPTRSGPHALAGSARCHVDTASTTRHARHASRWSRDCGNRMVASPWQATGSRRPPGPVPSCSGLLLDSIEDALEDAAIDVVGGCLSGG
jgi:hypothetical protein